jgi:hypothetical protein
MEKNKNYINDSKTSEESDASDSDFDIEFVIISILLMPTVAAALARSELFEKWIMRITHF